MKQNNRSQWKGKRGDKPAAEAKTPEIILPHSIEAEKGLIGAILQDNNIFDEVAGILQPDDFFGPETASYYEAISREMMRADGISATPITIASRYFSSMDGVSQKAKSDLDGMLTCALRGDPRQYARTIADLAERRRAHKAFTEGAIAALDPKNAGYLDDAMTALENRSKAGEFEDMTALSDKLLSDIERLAAGEIIEESGFVAGFKCLDNIMSPICPGNYVTIAAPTGQGKTSFGCQIAYNLAKQGANVAYFTLEMSAEHLQRALIAMIAGVDKRNLKPGKPTAEDVAAWKRATVEYQKLRLQIIDAQGQTPEQIFAQVRALARKQKTNVVFIDYFGKVAMNGRFNSEQERANRKSNAFQQMAGSLKIPFVILHQLNREIYKRPDKTPILTDIRDTGAIENDSDVVLFIQRSDFALSMNEPDPSDAEKYWEWSEKMKQAQGKSTIWLAKDRATGEKGNVSLAYNGIGQYREIEHKPHTGPFNTGYGNNMTAKNMMARA